MPIRQTGRDRHVLMMVVWWWWVDDDGSSWRRFQSQGRCAFSHVHVGDPLNCLPFIHALSITFIITACLITTHTLSYISTHTTTGKSFSLVSIFCLSVPPACVQARYSTLSTSLCPTHVSISPSVINMRRQLTLAFLVGAAAWSTSEAFRPRGKSAG